MHYGHCVLLDLNVDWVHLGVAHALKDLPVILHDFLRLSANLAVNKQSLGHAHFIPN